MSIELYHGSHEKLSTINDTGLYAGIFASRDADIALSHAPVLHKIVLNEAEVLTQYALEYEIDYNAVKNIIIESVATFNDDELDAIWGIIVGDKSPHNSGLPDERILQIFSRSDLAEASWEAQRVRGIIAKKLGFKAVEMDDEHGTSYLVVTGTPVENA